MRYRFPASCLAVIHDGQPLAIAPDGTVDLETEVADLLACHGAVAIKPKSEEASPLPPTRPDGRRGTR